MHRAKSKRTTLRRHPERALDEREAIEKNLDQALFCHVGFTGDGRRVRDRGAARASRPDSTSAPARR